MRRLDRLEVLANGIAGAGGKACFAVTDVTRRADLAALVALACDRHGRLDVFISNAGIRAISRFDADTSGCRTVILHRRPTARESVVADQSRSARFGRAEEPLPANFRAGC
jgi:NAD(P)-dependent dehydrogenase (short-subunit alcohol dehydrogenase family)